MQIEELNKSQIVLLTLLISFVTSLATGIVTVSLMEQGITPVTNTVNQIVERTKEIIVKVPEPQEPIVITETKEIVVHQADLVAAAVAKSKNSSVVIYKKIFNETTDSTSTAQNINSATTIANTDDTNDEQASTTMAEEQVASVVIATDDTQVMTPAYTLQFATRAVVLPGGLLATDASAITDGVEYVLGNETAIEVMGTSAGITILKVDTGTAITIGNTNTLAKGQSIIAIYGTERLKVMTAIISDILLTSGSASAIEIDKAISTPGGILINMDGELIGMSTGISRTTGATWFTSGNTIESALHSGDNTDI